MRKSLKCESAVALMADLLDVWEVPVCASDLFKAYPEISKYTYAHALKQMVDSGLLYAAVDTHDRVYYTTMANRPVSAIQEYLCKGRLT